jgi:hypothetical protein
MDGARVIEFVRPHARKVTAGKWHGFTARGYDLHLRHEAAHYSGHLRGTTASNTEHRPNLPLPEAVPSGSAAAHWPVLDDAMVEAMKKDLGAVRLEDLTHGYCCQSVLAFLLGLRGEPQGFSDILRQEPREVLNLAEFKSLGEGLGVRLMAVQGDPNELPTDGRPFVYAVSGSEPNLHLVVAARTGADHCLTWAPPGQSQRVALADVARLATGGIYFVEAVESKGNMGSSAAAGGVPPAAWWIGAAVAAAIAGASLFRRRAAALVGISCLPLATMSCDEAGGFAASATRSSSVMLVFPQQEFGPVRLPFAGSTRIQVPVSNRSGREVRIWTESVSCSCLIPLEREIVVGAGSTSKLTFTIRGNYPGSSRQSIRLKTSDPLLPIVDLQCLLVVGAPIVARPEQMSITAFAGETVTDVLEVELVRPARVAEGQLEVACRTGFVRGLRRFVRHLPFQRSAHGPSPGGHLSDRPGSAQRPARHPLGEGASPPPAPRSKRRKLGSGENRFGARP